MPVSIYPNLASCAMAEHAFRSGYNSGMNIPAPATGIPSWSDRAADEKRTALLRAAGDVFARDGLDAPMPRIAAAAGAGVGSVYRQFPSKRELLAALVVERLAEVQRGATEALTCGEDPWSALTQLLWRLAERQVADDVMAEAMATVAGDREVESALESATAALERLMAGARAQGRLRDDATTLDLRLLFAAVRASGSLGPQAWRRMLELGIDALDAHGPPQGS